MRCKYETRNGRCGLPGSYAYRHKCYTEDMCKCHEPTTNADHIRSMTDEELAKFLCGISACFFENCPGAHLCTSDGGSANGIVKWIKQPYKEEK